MSDVRLIADKIIKCFNEGHILFVGGCGGLQSESQHFCGELVAKYKHVRQALPAFALGCNLATLTAISNDDLFHNVYAREIEAFGKNGDLLITMSTSGKSKVLVNAELQAKHMGIEVVRFPTNKELNDSRDKIARLQDYSIATNLTQETHLNMIHKISELVEEAFI